MNLPYQRSMGNVVEAAATVTSKTGQARIT